MKTLIQRLLVFFIGLPLVVSVVIFLPQRNHLALNIVVILFCGLGAAEFAAILAKKSPSVTSPEAGILGILVPLAFTLQISFGQNAAILPGLLITGASWLLVSNVFSAKEREDAAQRMASALAVMLYPGLFLVWIIRMTVLPEAGTVILIFLLMVIANDSAAWAAGMLFGKNNRGIIPVSPNKSLAGFIGGLAASVLAALSGVFFAPASFSSSRLPPAAAGIILGLVTGAAAVLGDLGESALKRSAALKDSGVLMPGRGGILDSVDSIALGAPVFYALYRILFA